MKKNVLLLLLSSFILVPAITADSDGQNKKKGVIAIGEALYWRTNFFIPYAITFETTTQGAVTLSTNQKFTNVTPSYDPGFRIGLGYFSPSSHWEIDANAIRFAQKKSDSTLANDSTRIGLLWDFSSQITLPTAVSANFSDSFIGFAVSAKRPFYTDKNISFGYTFGLVGVVLKEQLEIIADGQNIDSIPVHTVTTLKNAFNGLGPVNAVNTLWKFSRNAGFYGLGEFSVLIGKIPVEQTQFTTIGGAQPALFQITQNNRVFLRANLFAQIGIQYEQTFCDVVSVVFKLGYDFNFWPSQIAFARFAEVVAGQATPRINASDIGFHGFHFGGYLTF
ncbi:hypothetical protein HYX58_01585 [Candidatus Dependentiae bacterium]|nr:hypothetical protein [Candidatus Dependentiae bacterium]